MTETAVLSINQWINANKYYLYAFHQFQLDSIMNCDALVKYYPFPFMQI